MLVLARADAGGYPVPMRRLYVDEIVAEAVRAVAVVAAAKGLRVTSTHSARRRRLRATMGCCTG